MKSSTYGSVIREYRKRKGIGQTALSEALGYSKNTVSNWENGVARPDLDAVPEICRMLEIPLNVFFGCASRAKLTREESALIRAFRDLSEESREVLTENADTLLRAERRRKARLYRSIPHIQMGAAAGFTVPAEGLPAQDTLYIKKGGIADRADAVFDVNGGSMLPKYPDGCRVFVSYNEEIRGGEDGLFMVNGELFIKRREADGLRSYNPAYPLMRFADGDDVRPVGKVHGIADGLIYSEEEIE